MREECGAIVEINQMELYRLYLERGMDEAMEFTDYVNAFRRCGCAVTE